MSEMVELVARALSREIFGDQVPAGELPADFKRWASAAIEAMREPTEAMLAATEGNGPLLDWQAMIDEALK